MQLHELALVLHGIWCMLRHDRTIVAGIVLGIYEIALVIYYMARLLYSSLIENRWLGIVGESAGTVSIRATAIPYSLINIECCITRVFQLSSILAFLR